MAERTLSGESREGWFIPYRYAGSVDETLGYPLLSRMFRAERCTFETALDLIRDHRTELQRIGTDDPAPNPRWDQDWFSGLDAAAAYSLVRHHRPARIIEVGSGHSTRFMIRAISDGGINCHFTAIDPAPRADIAALPVEIINTVVQEAPAGLFDDLQAGDVLFIDSSHIIMPGTDVDRLFAEVIPALPSGVLVHVHDIFLPFAYPPVWQGRGYNEQSGLAPLIAAGVLKTVLPCQYAFREMTASVADKTGFIPRPRPNLDASFWCVKA